jgi:hypothetical protein
VTPARFHTIFPLATLSALTALSACALPMRPPPDATRGWSPLALAWDLDRGWPDPACDVHGLRLGLVGARHRTVTGVDLPGGVGRRDGNGGGLAAALVANETAGSFYGLQVAGLMNAGPYDDPDGHACWGIQVAPGNFADVRGVQLGLVNGIVFTHDTPHNSVTGIQVGLWNGGGVVAGLQAGGLGTTAHELDGVQIGTIAIAGRLRGVQLGLVNAVFDRGGLQIGLLNYNAGSIVPWLPLLNFSW